MTPHANIPFGFCHCGCGFKTNIALKKNVNAGHVIGQPFKYIIGHQSRRYTPEYTVKDCGFNTPCWVWVRSLDSGGYGIKRDRKIFGGKGKSRPAHILFWESVNGPTPAGKELHHKCEVRACVNPDHLEPVTRLEHRRLRNLEQKTHCGWGHELTGQNALSWQGRTVCGVCRERVRRQSVQRSLATS